MVTNTQEFCLIAHSFVLGFQWCEENPPIHVTRCCARMTCMWVTVNRTTSGGIHVAALSCTPALDHFLVS